MTGINRLNQTQKSDVTAKPSDPSAKNRGNSNFEFLVSQILASKAKINLV